MDSVVPQSLDTSHFYRFPLISLHRSAVCEMTGVYASANVAAASGSSERIHTVGVFAKGFLWGITGEGLKFIQQGKDRISWNERGENVPRILLNRSDEKRWVT